VTGIIDATGDLVVNYTYDAWGSVNVSNPSMIWGAPIHPVGHANPIRYRGYYYDVETDWYFLQTRYYNPEWKRFINADALFIAGDALTGANMYAYCDGNPVMYVDPTGMAGLNPPLNKKSGMDLFNFDPAAFFSALSWLGQNIFWVFGDQGVNVFLQIFNGDILRDWRNNYGGLVEFYYLTRDAFNNSLGSFTTFVGNIAKGMSGAIDRFNVWLQSQTETAKVYRGDGTEVIIGWLGIVLDRMSQDGSLLLEYAGKFFEILGFVAALFM